MRYSASIFASLSGAAYVVITLYMKNLKKGQIARRNASNKHLRRAFSDIKATNSAGLRRNAQRDEDPELSLEEQKLS
jgi:hypothetical protein